MNFFLFGIQGSGKATQAKILKEKLKLWSYDSGATLRNIALGNDNFATFIKDKIDSGEFVDDSLIMKMVESFLSAVPDKQDIILDGIPRNVHQGHLLVDLFKRYRRPFTGIYLMLDKEQAVERILKRFELEKRTDDKKEIILKRIELFYKETLPAIEYFKSTHHLLEINANQSIEQVSADVANAILPLIKNHL